MINEVTFWEFSSQLESLFSGFTQFFQINVRIFSSETSNTYLLTIYYNLVTDYCDGRFKGWGGGFNIQTSIQNSAILNDFMVVFIRSPGIYWIITLQSATMSFTPFHNHLLHIIISKRNCESFVNETNSDGIILSLHSTIHNCCFRKSSLKELESQTLWQTAHSSSPPQDHIPS